MEGFSFRIIQLLIPWLNEMWAPSLKTCQMHFNAKLKAAPNLNPTVKLHGCHKIARWLVLKNVVDFRMVEKISHRNSHHRSLNIDEYQKA